MLNTVEVSCPYCGEPQAIEIDPSGGKRQSYTEDCQVCCRPWRVQVRFRGGEAEVRLYAEDETYDPD
jgi:transposase-like protein